MHCTVLCTTYTVPQTKRLATAWLRICRTKTNFDTELYVHISWFKSIETVQTVASVYSSKANNNISSVFTIESPC